MPLSGFSYIKGYIILLVVVERLRGGINCNRDAF